MSNRNPLLIVYVGPVKRGEEHQKFGSVDENGDNLIIRPFLFGFAF